VLEEIKKAGDPTNCAYAAALLLIGLNRSQEAVHALEASYAAGSIWSLGFRCDPMLKPLSDDRRFRELLRKAGPTRVNGSFKTQQET